MTIRPATPADGPAMAAIYRPYVLETAITFDEVPPTGETFSRQIAESQLPGFIAERDGRVIGYAVATPHGTRASFRWSVNCGIYIAPDSVRLGAGRALYLHLLDELRRRNYVHAYAAITLPNSQSVGLHEALGFRPVATFPDAGYKLGHWRSVGWWEKQLCELPNLPTEPLAP